MSETLAIIAALVIPFGIAWLANWYGRAVARRRWEEFCDRTELDSRAQSFREALALSDNECAEYVAVNDQNRIVTFEKWPVIGEEEVVSVHEGRHK